jgi:Fe-S-cluster containining protein
MKNITPKPKTQGLTVLKPEDNFRFDCNDGLECFTRCFRDTTIFLTPYDILRLKNALAIPSETFLRDYTLSVIGTAGLPAVVLKLQNDAARSCPLVTPRGCAVYSNRPWSCRIYPLQPESTKITEKADRQYYSIMGVPFCLGLSEDKVSTVAEWQEEQGIPIYLEMEKLFKKISMNEFLAGKRIENQKIRDMYYLACYDLDRFRRFVFESTFLKRFETDPDDIDKIKHDDVALYKFAMKWLEYGLIGQHVLKVKPDAMAAKKQEFGTR